jgi:hypothetical protein
MEQRMVADFTLGRNRKQRDLSVENEVLSTIIKLKV